MTLVQKEIKAVYLWDTKVRPWLVNFATQWPCPDGFHIPQSSERTNIFNAWESIWAWNLSGDTNAKNRKIINYLKLPTHWARSGSDGSASTSQANGYYASPIWYDSSNCYVLRIPRDTNSLDVSSTNRFTNGTNIRPFRNEPVVPNSSWTVLYQWTWTAGIYHSSTLWLISISSNWTTRYTIADKNLGATTTFDAWDATQTAENCGGQFQWGNNYMFPFSWTVTTSTARVDATNYWPWNYYSDSTFRRRTSSPYSWDTSGNKNLRWWEDGNVPVS